MIYLGIDVRTESMLSITPSKESCVIQLMSIITSVAKLHKTEIGKELKKDSIGWQP